MDKTMVVMMADEMAALMAASMGVKLAALMVD